MNLREQLIAGLIGLSDHPFRTFLTMLGIIFGVAAVIGMVSIGAGAEREALEELKKFGTNSIRINSVEIEGTRLKDAIKKLARGLSLDDVAYLREICPFLKLVVPEKTSDFKVYNLGKKPMVKVIGVGDRFLEASRFEVVQGRFFSAAEADQCVPVAVLGFDAAKELFGANTPVGEAVQIGRHRFRVVGVMQAQGQGKGKLAIKSRNHDRDLYIPMNTMLRRLYPEKEEDKERYHQVTSLWVTVADGVDLIAAKDVVMTILKRRHRDIPDVEALVPLEILQQSQKTQKLFNLVMALIAGISLLVGGIGIMNIMLASVNERTREIGVRRALGASKRDIVVQFLVEATLISLFGGLFGIIVGVGLSFGIAGYTGWMTVIPLKAVLLAFFVSISVGIVFGSFPAVKAANLDPVTALRYE